MSSRSEAYAIASYQPLRLIVGIDSDPPPEGDWLVNRMRFWIKDGCEPRVLIDVLECGHRLESRILQNSSGHPYVFDAHVTLRRCSKCPRVEKAAGSLS